MPSFLSPSSTAAVLPDFRPPKSPRRFFTFSILSSNLPPLPPLNPSMSYFGKGSDRSSSGVTVVRTPQDAAGGMRQAAGCISPPSDQAPLPPVPPLPSLSSLPNLSSQARYPQPSINMHTHGYGHQPSKSVDSSNLYRPSKLERMGVYRSTSARDDLRSGLDRSTSGLVKSSSAAPVFERQIEIEESDRLGPMPATPARPLRESPFVSPGHSNSQSISTNYVSSPPVSFHSRSKPTARSPRLSTTTSNLTSPSISTVPLSPSSKRPSLISNIKLTPRSSPLTTFDTPFHAALLSCTRKPLPKLSCGEQDSITLVNIEFAYSFSDPPRNESVILPLEMLKKGGGKLHDWVMDCLKAQEDEEEKKTEKKEEIREERKLPEMTDGESAEESDWDSDCNLSALLRDEYLKSLIVSSPSPMSHTIPLPPIPSPATTVLDVPPFSNGSKSPVPPKSPKTPGYKRAQTRNQYTQLVSKPLISGTAIEPAVPPLAYAAASPSGLTLPLNIKRKTGRQLPLSHISQGVDASTPGKPKKGVFTEMRIFLTREAGVYHQISHRLISGRWNIWAKVGGAEVRDRVEAELEWLGMADLLQEMRRPILGLSHSRNQSKDLNLGLGLGFGGQETGRVNERLIDHFGIPERPVKSERRAEGVRTLCEKRKSESKWKERAREKSLVLRSGYI
ncbi:hypothetical protein I307_01857 [Cryptococcus deuterogattii 99/473]|uniref:Uncharacterized protein n=2 Tax=Cryptococcus deuterogattii TaxID=1859096 RepID=A0A0D0TWQ5_9TREE|nr:hypothetical protein CNBG_1662 [Cryptococcus deuterogattii R265]KIR40303.1 hypothetical protein I313_03627 [Cryptococcus deuterogattii Ram5]KIR72014.1 hypothetical protein I310_04066 [Cryptococcus deuterogattii CA1014]KIR99844.1 hypothetical protein L804_02480 [Cryptococcus deuterogattii 2001/935-1]KIY58544.1 hypothetical protein I307_01857 [Cryptococcus deuterogattii 99/473]